MNILVSGSSGLVGSAFCDDARAKGHVVKRLVRRAPQSNDEVSWGPEEARLEANSIEGMDAVVHLSGESVSEGRWNEAKKVRIRDSRVKSTLLLADTLAYLSNRPKVMVSMSAVGYYGDRGDQVLREDSGPGSSFLAESCRAWEGATAAAAQKGIRVVMLRTGIVLSGKGGALAKMLLPFKMGVGGKIGTGEQYWSWIDLEDVIGVIEFAIGAETMQGPVNNVSPNPVTNAEFTRTLGHVLGRPTIFPMPATAARLAFGEMADALLLASARVEPSSLAHAGYQFQYPDLDGALHHQLKR
jgi:uncharacterized protein